MSNLDLLCVALIALVLLFDHFVLWRAFLRRADADAGRARRWIYPRLAAELWTLAAFVLVLWVYGKRAWGALRLVELHGWRLLAALVLVFGLAITLGRTIVKVARPKRRIRMKMADHVERFAPHTRNELGLWMLLSVSAGFSEELIFRGYLIWVFTPLLGLWGAAALSLVLFAAAHGYQGIRGALTVGVAALLFTLPVLILGSLWPAIAMHVVTDVEEGIVAWLVLRERHEGDVLPSAAVASLIGDRAPLG